MHASNKINTRFVKRIFLYPYDPYKFKNNDKYTAKRQENC